MAFTLRHGIVLGGAVLALAFGVGLNALFALPVLFLFALGARQSLRLDERGVRYRALVPSEGFEVAWAQIREVVVDTVVVGAPGSSRNTVARVRFVPHDGPPRVATLFSEAGRARVLAACRERGVSVVDGR